MSRRRPSTNERRDNTGYAVSQRIRKRVEEIFGGQDSRRPPRTRFKGIERTQLAAYVVGAAYTSVAWRLLLPRPREMRSRERRGRSPANLTPARAPPRCSQTTLLQHPARSPLPRRAASTANDSASAAGAIRTSRGDGEQDRQSRYSTRIRSDFRGSGPTAANPQLCSSGRSLKRGAEQLWIGSVLSGCLGWLFLGMTVGWAGVTAVGGSVLLLAGADHSTRGRVCWA